MSHNEDVQRALCAVDAGNAEHWPTVAAILADEVRRFRLQSLRDWLSPSIPAGLVPFIEDELAKDRHPQAVLEEVVQRLRQADA